MFSALTRCHAASLSGRRGYCGEQRREKSSRCSYHRRRLSYDSSAGGGRGGGGRAEGKLVFLVCALCGVLGVGGGTSRVADSLSCNEGFPRAALPQGYALSKFRAAGKCRTDRVPASHVECMHLASRSRQLPAYRLLTGSENFPLIELSVF